MHSSLYLKYHPSLFNLSKPVENSRFKEHLLCYNASSSPCHKESSFLWALRHIIQLSSLSLKKCMILYFPALCFFFQLQCLSHNTCHFCFSVLSFRLAILPPVHTQVLQKQSSFSHRYVLSSDIHPRNLHIIFETPFSAWLPLHPVCDPALLCPVGFHSSCWFFCCCLCPSLLLIWFMSSDQTDLTTACTSPLFKVSLLPTKSKFQTLAF